MSGIWRRIKEWYFRRSLKSNLKKELVKKDLDVEFDAVGMEHEAGLEKPTGNSKDTIPYQKFEVGNTVHKSKNYIIQNDSNMYYHSCRSKSYGNINTCKDSTGRKVEYEWVDTPVRATRYTWDTALRMVTKTWIQSQSPVIIDIKQLF